MNRNTAKTRDVKNHRDHPLPVAPHGDPEHEESLIDEAVAESFPASDPSSPAADDFDKPVRQQPARPGNEDDVSPSKTQR